MRYFITIYLVLQLGLALNAQIIHVPAQYVSIQQAVDAANPGDTILVETGTYIENLVITKPLTLASVFLLSNQIEDVQNTVIDGNQTGAVVTVKDIATDTLRLIGFTLTKGTGELADPHEFGFESLHGGGLFVEHVQQAFFNYLIIKDNHLVTEHNNAGGIYAFESGITLMNSEVDNNSVNGFSFHGEGAGMFLMNCTTSVINCSIINNISDVNYGEGGGIYTRNGQLRLENSIIAGNQSIRAGAIISYNTVLQLYNCDVNTNTAMLTGAILVTNQEVREVIFHHCNVAYNLATNSNGAILLNKAVADIRNCVFNDNNGGNNGGAMMIDESEVNILDTEIIRNISESGIGGNGSGIFASYSAVKMQRVVLNENYCGPTSVYFTKGGALFLYMSMIEMDSVIMSNNVANVGGAINANSSELSMRHCLINGHHGKMGGAIYSYGTDYKILSSTIVNNTADEGGACQFQSDSVWMVNSILWGNSPDEINFTLSGNGKLSQMNFVHSNVRGWDSNFSNKHNADITWHQGNLDVDPLFADEDFGDFSLLEDSPMIDAGIAHFEWNGYVVADYTAMDYTGSSPDIGAFESETVTQISHLSKSPQIKTYPNPFLQELIVSAVNPIQKLQIHSLTGGSILSLEPHNKNVLIPANRLKTGAYILKAYIDGAVTTKLVIKGTTN
ncbi:MAG: T9SS type A sorting domain-containing protein [Bacteroidales bacterium]|jgi:hypothetical protein|nr:T9SS type A sorting domain-containing protein [Bacteroidales bacterium]